MDAISAIGRHVDLRKKTIELVTSLRNPEVVDSSRSGAA